MEYTQSLLAAYVKERNVFKWCAVNSEQDLQGL